MQEGARDALLTMAIAHEETAEAGEPQDDLLNMEYMTSELAYKLSRRGICTMEDLAEQSTDELEEIEGIEMLGSESGGIGKALGGLYVLPLVKGSDALGKIAEDGNQQIGQHSGRHLSPPIGGNGLQ